MLEETGFIDVEIGEGTDVFAGASGETNARRYEVGGFTFKARKPKASDTSGA